MKLPKKPLEQARASEQYPKFKSELLHDHAPLAGDIDYRYHPHYDNQPRPEDGTPARQTWRFGVPEVAILPEKFAKRFEASQTSLVRRLEGTVREPRVFPKRVQAGQARESMFSKYARLQRERQGQNLELKSEIPNLERQVESETPKLEPVETPNLEPVETPNLERQAQLEERKTRVLSRFKKTSGLFSEESKHVQKARTLKTTYESRVEQKLEERADQHLEGLRRPDFDANTNPLAAISEHFITKASENQPTRAFERNQHITQAVRPAASNLIRTARGTGFKTAQLTSAIQRFTDSTANKAVRTGVMTGLHNSPSLSLEVQRSLEASDATLEVQRQEFLTEAREAENNSSLSDRISQELNSGVPLEENIRKQLEAHFNTDLSKIRVHTDGKAHELAKSVNAIAFTTGKDIFFQSGTYDPNSSAGFELLAHETAHTIQQSAGIVNPGIDSSSGLESDAKLEGQKAAGNKTNLERQVNNFNDYLLKPNLEKVQTPVSRSQTNAVQREPVKTEAPTAKEEPQGTKLNLRGAAFNEKYPVKLRSSMETSSEMNVVTKIPFGTTFLITESIGSWYKIKLDSDQTGFVAGENIKVAPDAQSVLYKIKSGDNAIDIAQKHYKAKLGLDLRFYVGVLAKLNPDSIKMPSDKVAWGDDSSVTAWKNANPMVGFFIWIPSQAYAQSLKGTVNNGKLSDHPLEAAAEVGKGIVKKTIKELGGDGVISTLESIGHNVSLIWDNPGAFMDNLQKSFEQGFGNFQTHFGEHLQTGVMQWLQSALGATFDIPKTADSAGLLSVGLQVVGLDYNKNLRPMLASSLPNGGLAALEGSGGVLQDVLKTGSLTPVIQMVQSREKAFESMLSGLPTTILNSLKDFAIKSIVTAGIKKMLTMLVPGGGLVQAAINIYNAITFFMDRAKQIGAFVQNLTSSFASIAKGDIKAAVKTIEAVLGSGLSLALGFLASAAGLTKIASSIKAALDKIQKPAQAILVKIKDWIVRMFSSLVKKVTPGSKPVTGDKSSGKPTDAPKPAATSSINISDHLVTSKMSIEGDVETHQVWAEIKGGQPIMMMASTPKEIIAHLQDFKADARLKLKTDSPEFKIVSDQISASGKDVGKGIAEMRNILKVTNPRASNTSDKVKTLPGSKVSSDADLSKIAVNTLTSVKQRMEIAFPILNSAGVTVDNLKQAVSLAGGIVQFMKDIAAGKAPGGIDHAQLKKLWSQQTGNKLQHRETLKTMFRNAMPGKHEWIPSDMMLAVIERDMDADKMGIVPEWIDLQHNFRIDTEHVVFKPSYESIQEYNGKNYSVLNGHSGAIYLVNKTLSGNTYSPRTEHQADFHNELRENFKSINTKVDLLNKIKTTAQKWAWDGNGNPTNPIHPNLVWKNNSQYVDLSNGSGLNKLKANLSSYFTNLIKQIEDLK